MGINTLKRKMKKELRIGQIARNMHISRKEAADKLDMAKEKYEISNKEFCEKELYYLDDEQLKSGKRYSLVEIVSEQNHVSYGVAARQMSHAKEKYGISSYTFAEKKMFDADDVQLQGLADELAKNEQKHLRKICNAIDWTMEQAIAETSRIKKEFNIGIRKYFDEQLFLCTDEEIATKDEEWKKIRKANITRVAKETGWERKQVIKHMYKCRVVYYINNEYYIVFKCWELSDEKLETYARSRESRELSNKYNTGNIGKLANKALFDQEYKDFIKRKFWINRDTNFEEFQIFAEGLEEVFCKPVNLNCGKGAQRIALKGNLREIYDHFMEREKLLVEECVNQHTAMAKIFPNSVNTIRIVTLLKDDVCHTLCSFIRFGCYGVTDNFGSGGVLAAVDLETGTISTPAIDKKGNVVEDHPITGERILGFQIPHWDMAMDICEKAIRAVDEINYVGWDVAICQDKVVIIEGNSIPDVGAYQAAFAPMKEGQKHLFTPYL